MTTPLMLDPELTNDEKIPKRGFWKPGRAALNKRTALVSCPGCGTILSIRAHTIKDDGHVEPSLVCPMDDCNFHDYVELVGWKP